MRAKIELPPVVIKVVEDYLAAFGVQADKGLIPVKIPSLVALARKIGVTTKVLKQWAEENEELGELEAKLTELQEEILLDGGVLGRLNPAIVKLALGKHGYKEQSEQQVVTATIPDLSEEQYNEIIAKEYERTIRRSKDKTKTSV